MENILSGLLDQVLGKGEKATKTNRKYFCPFPGCPSLNKNKKKLEVDVVTDSEGHNKWACWVCSERGLTIRSLFRKIDAPKHAFQSLGSIIVKGDYDTPDNTSFEGDLPNEYKFLLDVKPTDIMAKHALLYLKKRRVNREDIIKYQIGFCEEGRYAERIIVPSYDTTGNINFFVGRSFDPETKLKYKFPEISRDIIPFEMYVNWEVPIVLCEGVFDMFAIKRNVVPLLGKSITPRLMKKLIESKIRKIYIALDNDALKMALKHCSTLMAMGKRVYLVSTEEKDASEMGFKSFLNNIQSTPELTPDKLLKLKMSL
jgi:hypothetical protein